MAHIEIVYTCTLPETNSQFAPENWMLGRQAAFPFEGLKRPIFQVAKLAVRIQGGYLAACIVCMTFEEEPQITGVPNHHWIMAPPPEIRVSFSAWRPAISGGWPLGGGRLIGHKILNAVNNHGDGKSPKDRVVPLPNGLYMAYKWGWSYLLTNWDDPPSVRLSSLYCWCWSLGNFHLWVPRHERYDRRGGRLAFSLNKWDPQPIVVVPVDPSYPMDPSSCSECT